MTRQLADGPPRGGWHQEQRISLEAVLRHYIWGSAYAVFREGELGDAGIGDAGRLRVLGGPTSRALDKGHGRLP